MILKVTVGLKMAKLSECSLSHRSASLSLFAAALAAACSWDRLRQVHRSSLSKRKVTIATKTLREQSDAPISKT